MPIALRATPGSAASASKAAGTSCRLSSRVTDMRWARVHSAFGRSTRRQAQPSAQSACSSVR
ncbi:hypothetical protein [Variovorax sp. JS1663]|uniref:hypothetical protein n=1 Tax=Variovorax sp. JS1663 TaxID=1851577 RepID=UPI000B347104|nr:hypothetical protein [Variovorax sp. JS1663]OUM03697.1 hypothetical protein A8M77_04040 [Variovorax sp. JS1663]